jgi:hypothetical protein
MDFVRRIPVAIRRESTQGGKSRPGKKAAKKAAKKKKAGKKKAARRKKTAGPKRAETRPPQSVRAAAPAPRAPHAATVARLYPERIGTVSHYYASAEAAIVRIERGALQVGDAVHFRGHTTDFYERIEELKLDDQSVEAARAGQTVGIRLARAVRENDGVYLLSE